MDLKVTLNEGLRPDMGIRSDEVFCPILPGERANLFHAANRFLRLLLDDRGLELTEEEKYLQTILMPLARCEDGHLIATVSALLLSLVEGKTDCPISGVFGAGKTRAAAATIAGLITVAFPANYGSHQRKRGFTGFCGAYFET